MTQQERVKLVNEILAAVQKARSNFEEDIIKDDEDKGAMMVDLHPLVMSLDHPLAFNNMPPLMAICIKFVRQGSDRKYRYV